MSMREKIAIDVVLLLPEEINNICKELNKTSNKRDYISFEDGYNPHITLGMGSLFVSNISAFKQDLLSTLSDFKMPEVVLTSLASGKYDHFTVGASENLQSLHNIIFDVITKHGAGPVTTENFFELSEPSSIIDWVNNFKENSAYSNYHSHITLGVGIKEIPLKFPITFKPKSIGFFHLGKHGTCKKMLADFKLE